LRKLSLLLLVLPLCTSVGSAAPLCVDGDTLANYITAGSCFANAGLGVQVLYSFAPAAFQYFQDGSSVLTASDITVHTVIGPGSPEAGLRFDVANFIAPADGTFADINLTFDVSVALQPPGFIYQLSGAHLGVTSTLPADPNATAIAVESEQVNGAFNLQLINPADPNDLVNQNFPLQTLLEPNIDISVNTSGTQVTNWTESFDLTNVPEPGTLAFIPGGLILLGLLRSKRYAKSILPLVALLVLSAVKSHAVALCTDLNTINGVPTSQTSLGLDKYIAYTTNFGGCTMNDMLFKFNSFTLAPGSTGSTLASAASTALIFTLNNHTGSATDVIGIQYIPQATSTGTTSQTFSYSYTVTAPLFKITKLTGTTSGTLTNVARTTTVSPGATPTSFTGLTPSFAIADPLSTTLTVTESIAFSAVSGTKHISNMTETFTEAVPEPLTSVLFGSALLGIGLLARKRRLV
jgi:hypothetical protein